MDNIIDVARKLALKSVVNPDFDTFRRKICRWYSKSFSTPLKEVEEDIVFFDVLMHYFEDLFEQLEDKDKQEQLKLAIETTEERSRREIKEDLEEQEFLEMAVKEEAERAKKSIDYSKVAKQVKKDKLLKKTEDLPEIDIRIEDKVDLDKPPF
jgi:hypothetical protein